jgi:hypothetical protein
MYLELNQQQADAGAQTWAGWVALGGLVEVVRRVQAQGRDAETRSHLPLPPKSLSNTLHLLIT